MGVEPLPSFADVVAAHDRIAPHVVRTPMLRSDAFDARCSRPVWLKCENLQHGGAFKYRGALNAVLQLPAGEVEAVATHSSGNHGRALALAARSRGLACIVVVPHDAPAAKLEAIRETGAELVLCEPGIAAREAALARVLSTRVAHVVHPFDDARVIAGQGTVALEMAADHPEIEVFVAPVGGGGLIGGTALAVGGTLPLARVVAAEPAAADDAWRSFVSGERASIDVPHTLADGLKGRIGVRNFEILRRDVDDVVRVAEARIVAAMRAVLEDFKLLIEPSSAVAIAAVMDGQVGVDDETVGVIVSGGNVDLGQCPFLAGRIR